MEKTDQPITAEKIKLLLAEQLGLNSDDISNEDSLIEDLHMSPADLTDFLETLSAKNADTSAVDLTEIETVEELLEQLGINDY